MSLAWRYVDRGRRQQLVGELSDILEQDTTIDLEFKDALKKESVPERLAAFLADLLIYAVGIDPTERDKEYPVENYNLPMSNDWFMGREKELAEIERNFADGNRMQILYGMGGMGKSQIARKFAYDHYRSYSLIHWINASTFESIAVCYRVFLAEKKITPAGKTTEAICQSYIKYIDSHSDWLLVYDNLDYYTDKEYAKFADLCLPKNQAAGNILITSRNKRSIGKAKRIEIGTLPGTDAVAFLLQRTGSSDTAGAKQLVKRLGRFPLALEIAGAYIHATPGCDFSTYISYLERETKILNQMVEVTNYGETIKDILLLTMKRIREDRGGDMISLCIEDVLHLCSYNRRYYDDELDTLFEANSELQIDKAIFRLAYRAVLSFALKFMCMLWPAEEHEGWTQRDFEDAAQFYKNDYPIVDYTDIYNPEFLPKGTKVRRTPRQTTSYYRMIRSIYKNIIELGLQGKENKDFKITRENLIAKRAENNEKKP